MVFQHQSGRFIWSGMLVAMLWLLTACNSADGNAAAQNATASSTVTMTIVTPRSASGTQGEGPAIVVAPSPVPGGPAGSQEVVLQDRTLIIYRVVKQKSASANSVLINLDLAVHNTSGKAIPNLAAFFQLIGPEGDTFSYQYNSSDSFYGTIAAYTTNRDSIAFQIPTAAATHMSLLYHPEIAKETIIVLLKMA